MRKLAVWVGAALLAVVAIGVIWLFLVICGTPLKPATPPLLSGARAPGGWNSGWCPPGDGDFVGSPDTEGRSKEIEHRLAARFPPGSSETALVEYLRSQGFELVSPCDNDPSIRRAVFRQSGGGLFGPYPANAFVGWKVDSAGRVVWTRGTISFTGL